MKTLETKIQEISKHYNKMLENEGCSRHHITQ